MTIWIAITLLAISAGVTFAAYDFIVALFRGPRDYYNHGKPRPSILFRKMYMEAYTNEEKKIGNTLDDELDKMLGR